MEPTQSQPPVDEAKTFLYHWLGKNKIVPEYNVRSAGTKQRQRFLCELVVDGFPYRAAGNSTSKKDAATNAAKDFIQYLIRTGKLTPAEIPDSVLSFVPSIPETSDQISGPSQLNFSRPVFPRGAGPREMGEDYRPRIDGHAGPNFDAINAQKMAEAESLDVNAALHGNWTIENSKSRLHQFLQANQIKTDYSYIGVGPAHSKSFQCEMFFYVKQLGREIRARETGSTKQTSSKSVALSLVRQLYHLKVIEPFSGVTKRDREAESLKPYDVSVDPALMAEVENVLKKLNVKPPSVAMNQPENPEEELSKTAGVNLVTDMRKDLPFLSTKEDTNNFSVVSWSPPLPNWNPWTSNNIDEGHMASASLEQLSTEFLQSIREVQQMNTQYQKLYTTRSKLPVFAEKSNIMSAIADNPIILIKGDTGCGKTTQICQFILDDYLLSEMGAHCNIVVTQPRRISAISVAERVAAERAEDLGQTVGYSVRFESCLPRPYASILFCTVGVLLRKLEAGLRGVSHVIVDEIHERDVNTDFLLVVLRDMLSIYPELRVILMSATIDDTLFRKYFNGCPVLFIEGRAFPVETFYLEDIVERIQFMPNPETLRAAKKKKATEDDDDEFGTADSSNENLNIIAPGSGYSNQTQRAMSLISERDINLELLVALLSHIHEMQAHEEHKSSVLIFLPGWNLIFLVLKYLLMHPIFGTQSFSVLPLHSQLPREDQHRVFEPVPVRVTKIILSTNIAETSITIDDVGFVIDTCKAKTKLFTSHNNMTSYVTTWASKCNLQQRRGRAGRVMAGVCFHLCSRARLEKLEENMTAEIFRTPLHEIALMIKLLRLGGIAHFLSKAPEPPPLDAVIEAQAVLYELKCLNINGDLTGLGRVLAKLPIDPRLGKMIVMGIIFGCADALAIIAANSSNMNEVFNIGFENRRLSHVQRAFGARRNSDHFALLNAFQQWCHHEHKGNAEDFCKEKMLSLPSLRMTRDSKNQLLQVLSSIGFPDDQLCPVRLVFREESVILDNIAALLVAGMYPNVCVHKGKRKVLTTESKDALVHKASVNCSKFDIEFTYPFFIFGEKIRTRAVSCKQMTNISPLHLLLFGSIKVEALPSEIIRLDNWLNLRMNPEYAAAIISLRGPIENLVTKATEDPEGFFPLIPEDDMVISVVSKLCRLSAAQYGLEDQSYTNSRDQANFQYGRQAEQQYYESYESETQYDGGAGEEFEADFESGETSEDQEARGVKRGHDGQDSADGGIEFASGNGSFVQGRSHGPPPPKRGLFGRGGLDTSVRQPYTPRGGFNPVNKFSPRGYSPSSSPRTGFQSGFAGGTGGFGSQPSGGNFNNRGGAFRSGSGFQPRNLMQTRFSSGFEPRQRFFSSNRGGWSARGNMSRGNPRGSFSGRTPNRGGSSFRPHNYPY